MSALIDSDAFCKLGGCGLLEAVVRAIGTELSHTKRLAALPHMLRKGALARRVGTLREPLEQLATSLGVAPETGALWLDRILTNAPDVDVGEAQLFALAAEHSDVLLITGDKRAVEAIGRVWDSTKLGRAYVKRPLLRPLMDGGCDRASARQPLTAPSVSPVTM